MSVRRVLDGLVVVAIGLVLLGNTTGVLPWSVWFTILMLWPLLLVAAGIDIIGRSLDNTWLRVLSGLLVIGGIAYGAYIGFVAPGGPDAPWIPVPLRAGTLHTYVMTEPANPAVTRGSVRIEGGIGELLVHQGQWLVGLEAASPLGKPRFDVNTSGDHVDARVGLGSSGPVAWPLNTDTRLQVALGTGIDWDVRMDAGASRLDVDLSGVTVSRLRANMGASNGDVKLGRPAAGGSQAEIDAGVSNLDLWVPKEDAVEIRVESGLGTVKMPEGLSPVSGQDRTWRTAGFDQASDTWRILVKAGVSTVRVERY